MRHVLLLLGLASSLTSACVIDERKFDAKLAAARADDDDETSAPEAGTEGPTDSPECVTYCERAMNNCVEENAIYASMDTCLAICKLLPLEPGPDEELRTSNTVACRSEQARLASQTGEPEVHCPIAGPGGSPTGRGEGCGNNCESYCMIQPQTCAETDELILEQAECERRCAALPDRGAFDVVEDHDANNIQCRLVHLSSAALGSIAAEDHCWHSSITPREGSPCGLLADRTPDCEQYCDVVARACRDDLAVYDDEDHCMDSCGLLEVGAGDHRTQDTLGCRLYHAYASLEDPARHCPHASISGDGHCGVDNCESYCNLANRACPDEFAQEHDSTEACLAECAELEGAAADMGYTAEDVREGDTVQCRIYHATLAATDRDACEAVFGSAPCN